MNYRDKKRLTNKDKSLIKARYFAKVEEYKTKTIDELTDIFRNTKISATDRNAIIAATEYLMQDSMDKITTMKIDSEIDAE
jgi:hypothetical protein